MNAPQPTNAWWVCNRSSIVFDENVQICDGDQMRLEPCADGTFEVKVNGITVTKARYVHA